MMSELFAFWRCSRFAIGACIAHPEILTLGGVSLAMAIPDQGCRYRAKKFATRGAAAGGDYANGVRGAAPAGRPTRRRALKTSRRACRRNYERPFREGHR